jgi:glycosyltransferase involved in cell wall biosynthesis
MANAKIALCITDLDVGGAEQAMVALATRLDRSQFTPVVYCLGPTPENPDASCVPPLEAAGVEVHCLGARGVWSLPHVVRQLGEHFARQRPDLVQAFLFHANLVSRIAARRANVRQVVCGIRVAERNSRWHLWLDRWTTRLVDRYVCVSESVAEFCRTRARLPPERVLVIPNGIDCQRYPARDPVAPILLGVPADRRLVTFVGRLEPQKGLRWLIESAPQWLARLSDCDLVVVGRGPEQSSLQRLCDEAGIAERVHWVGWRADVPQVLAASHLLVLPSRWEGMPNAVLQAMASRLPVLATDVEGVRELLGENAEPQVVSYGDTRALVDKLVAILSHPALSAELGTRNRHRAERQFRIDRVVAAYESLWTSLIERTE